MVRCFRVLGHGLGGDVPHPGHEDVRPDLVGDHQAVVGGVDLHGLFDLPALPDPTGGIVGGAEDGQVDLVLPELPVHVLVVHAPDAVLVPDEIAVHRRAAGVLQHMGEAHIGGGVEQDLVAGGGEHADGGADAAQHAVFVADVLLLQVRHALALPVPVDDGLIIGLRRGEVAQVGEAQPLLHGLQHAGGGGEAHVRDPHGDGGEALLHGDVGEGDQVYGDDVVSAPIQHGGEVVCHGIVLCLIPFTSRNPSRFRCCPRNRSPRSWRNARSPECCPRCWSP